MHSPSGLLCSYPATHGIVHQGGGVDGGGDGGGGNGGGAAGGGGDGADTAVTTVCGSPTAVIVTPRAAEKFAMSKGSDVALDMLLCIMLPCAVLFAAIVAMTTTLAGYASIRTADGGTPNQAASDAPNAA